MQAQEARPPYVTFGIKSEEDREASIKAGQYVAKNVFYAFITPQGSKDKFEYRAEEWFANLRQQVQQERFPAQWLEAFEKNFNAWKNNEEIPIDGTSVKNWPIASPAQVEMMLKMGVRTVEDMAVANEECLSRLGMGGRTLKQQAVNWIKTAKGEGVTSSEITKLEVENEALKARNKLLEESVIELSAALEKYLPPKPQPTPAEMIKL